MPDASLEPTLDWDEIQGNVLAGFNKDHQTIIGLRFGADTSKSRAYVRTLADQISSLHSLVEHRYARSAHFRRTGHELLETSVWTAVAFSHPGLQVLVPTDAAQFTDVEFIQGLAAVATSNLNDPADPAAPGNPAHWVVGGPEKTPDVLVVLASDHALTLEAEVESFLERADGFGVTAIYTETGHDLPHYDDPTENSPPGHEHFGFKDGISQPGIRGHYPDGTPVTPRHQGPKGDTDDSGPEFARPGQPLVCAGQFVLGYALQDPAFGRNANPPRPLGSSPHAVAPTWAANGSFLVFRRLRQLVGAFRTFSHASAASIADDTINPDRMSALVVGRWPSGAPVIRAPRDDNVTQATSELVNAFAYGSDNQMLGLPDDTQGVVCPVVAHVRKVNPRDQDTDQGSSTATLTKRVLRRGLPYGPPFRPPHDDDAVDRGLLFLCYQTSILHQFQFLTTDWMDDPSRPTNPGGPSGGSGIDLLVGQSANRTRNGVIRLSQPDGSITSETVGNTGLQVKDWVVPTGGGYFFAPSISAVRDVLGHL